MFVMCNLLIISASFSGSVDKKLPLILVNVDIRYSGKVLTSEA